MATKLHFQWNNRENATTGPRSKLSLTDFVANVTLALVRTTPALVKDWDNLYRTADAGEERYQGGRRVQNRCLQSGDFDTTWILTGITAVGGQADPDGGTSAFKLTELNTSSAVRSAHNTVASAACVAGRTYTMSVTAKAAEVGFITVSLGGTNDPDVVFDLSDGTVDQSQDVPLFTHSKSLGGGWYRLGVTGLSTAASQPMIALVDASGATIDDFGRDSYVGNGSDGVLVYHPQLEDVTGQLDTSPSEYVATTTAHVVEWFATKRHTTNILFPSNDLSAGIWTNFRCSDAQAVANNPLDSATDVNSLTEDGTASSTHYISQTWTTPIIGKQYTMSAYVKPSNRDWVRLSFGSGGFGTGSALAYYNVATGSTGTLGGDADASSMTLIADGYYRCVLTATCDHLTVAGPLLQILIASADATASFDGLSQESLLVYGLQVEEGAVATDYGATTDKLVSTDFDTAINPEGLLAEEARTNLQIQSQTFDDVAWTKTNSAVVADAATAPDGTVSMDRFDLTAGAGKHELYDLNTVVSGSTYVASVFVKDDGLGFAGVHFGAGNATDSIAALFDLSDGSLVGSVTGSTSGTILDTGAEDYGNGVWRIWISGSVVSTTGYIIVFGNDDNTPTWVGNRPEWTAIAGDDLFVWGAQLELGDVLTAYIATTTVAVARNLDSVTTSELGWYNQQGPGSLYGEMTLTTVNQVAERFLCQLGGSTNGWQMYMEDSALGRAQGSIRKSGGLSGLISVNSKYADGVTVKQAIGFNANDMVHYANGTAGTPDTNVDHPNTITALSVGGEGATNIANGVIGEIAYDDTRLSNSDLSDWSNGTGLPLSTDSTGRRVISRDLLFTLDRELLRSLHD